MEKNWWAKKERKKIVRCWSTMVRVVRCKDRDDDSKSRTKELDALFKQQKKNLWNESTTNMTQNDDISGGRKKKTWNQGKMRITTDDQLNPNDLKKESDNKEMAETNKTL